MILLLGTSVLAQSLPVSKEITDFVKSVASQKGIPKDEIKGIEEVDMNNLPQEINIKNIDKNNLAMYKLNVKENNGTNATRPVYVITASKTAFKKEVKKYTNKMLLNLGIPGTVSNSTFLLSGSGVKGSYENGYVMIRDGSITGLSTSLNIKNPISGGVAEIILYKNGKAIGFRNTINLDKIGPGVDYDSVNTGTINFQKGDVISAKVLLSREGQVEDINTLLEITTRDKV